MKRLTLALLLIVVIGLALFASSARAQGGSVYDMAVSNVGSGGSGSGSHYGLSSSIGQPDAGQVSGDAYTLGGGFWGGGVLVPIAEIHKIYLPVVIR